MILNIIAGCFYGACALGLTYCLINRKYRNLQNLSVFTLGLLMIAGGYLGLPDGKTFSDLGQLSTSEGWDFIFSMLIHMAIPMFLLIINTLSMSVREASGGNRE
jgi:hypothetical protein